MPRVRKKLTVSPKLGNRVMRPFSEAISVKQNQASRADMIAMMIQFI